jgi:acyl transferase domain-containing protein/3-hydroxymyristoyl/3-hydroxydecanoyl-(acyl carrier protein) dehydratase
MPGAFQTHPADAIAIVGIGGIFAASDSPDRLWANVLAGAVATRDVPPDRWLVDPADAIDPRIAQPDRVYTARGGFVGPIRFDPSGTALDAALVERLDPAFHLALVAASQAWRNARTDAIDRRRAGVVFGHIVLPTETASTMSLDLLGRTFEERLEDPTAFSVRRGSPDPDVGTTEGPSVRRGSPDPDVGTTEGLTEPNRPDRTADLRSRHRAGSGDPRPTSGQRGPSSFEPRNTFPAGLPAQIVAQAFGLEGVAYTLDAACASSLYALKLAVDELRSGRADAMIAGGVSRPDALYTQMGYSQLRALSPRGAAAPLDHRADGLIVGEGAGMFVLKRLGDAIRHGDHVHGIIAGIGLSNDVAGDLLAPDSDGQLRAMRAAYEQAEWKPSDVDLIECHATGTPRGDAVELASLRALWGEGGRRAGRCVIGSLKANIGHALTAAGAAGLLKVLLAMEHRTLPPSSNFERPNPRLGLDDGPFRVLNRAEPWPARDSGQPRRAAISGFGFGGINAHVLIEEFHKGTPAGSVRGTPPAAGEPPPIAIVGMAAQVGCRQGRDALGDLIYGPDEASPDHRLRTLELPVGRFRIPPKELAEMLPQQSLMLRVASEAIEASAWNADLAARTGVLIGIGLDLNTTNFHLRWSMANRARDLAPDLSPDELAGRIDELREAAGPALTANRTIGSLGGVVASRIAREFRIGGPSFTVSCDETSGIQAMAVAVDWLRGGELDAAIVGAVDFAADERAALARRQLGSVRSEGSDSAFCLVLKRLDDARRDGDRILALIRNIETATGGVGEIGPSGAATGLAEVVRAAAGLHHRIHLAADQPARFWLHDRTEGRRRATVSVTNLGGRASTVILEEEAETSARPALPNDLRRSGLFALEGEDDAAIFGRIRELDVLSREHSDESIDAIARRWWRRHPGDRRLPRGHAIVADGVESLRNLLAAAKRTPTAPRDRTPRGVAFVYPGLGSYFDGMGRELGLLWPDVLHRQDRENRSLRDQLAPDVWWTGKRPRTFADHRTPILGQVAVGSLVTDVLLGLGLAPDAAIGYSMGESAALVALRAWTNRDELAGRLQSSPLFATELSGPCEAARRTWGIPPDRSVPWVAGIVPKSAVDVHAAIAACGKGRVYVLIRNASDETVIGGDRAAVRDVVGTLRTSFLELPAVSTVHCEIGRLVESPYEALHDIETVAPPGIAFYSGVSGRRYAVDRRSAARAIAAQASRTIDFPATIENAYADGIGLFIEVGPGSSCTRLIDRILGDRPHVAVSACRPDRDAFAAVLDVLAACIGHRVPVDLSALYGDDGRPAEIEARPKATIRVEVGPPGFRLPPLPARPVPPAPTMNPDAEEPVKPLATLEIGPIAAALHDAERARSEAHRAFLRVAEGAADLIGRHVALQLDLLDSGGWAPPTESAPEVPALYGRRQCLELATGSVASVFGPEFAAVDRLPTRVRLPDEPLMFVDRILTLEGTPRSMENGRIVTEHDIRPGAWYLDGDRVAPCVAMEAGQADLVLSGYLGVDFLTEGRSLYRLLDANVTFHRGLPVVGDVLRYDIRITKFFRQGTTILFRFEYDATVGGEPLITMRDGCAGFFTAEELAAGKGVAPAKIESRMRPPAAPSREPHLTPTSPMQLDEAALDALRWGDLATAFGTPFDEVATIDGIGLPDGLMAMLRRVTALDPAGGPAGLGFIRAEADIRPGDWYMVCHFIDDRVMPGTLMYECCLHALRILLMRLGWVGPRGEVAFEPVPGVANRLKCRGQITEATRRVAYEVAIKERGYRPEPYAIADALIVADGKPIVSVTDLALQLSGTGRDALERLWRGCNSEERSVRRRGQE